MVIRAMDPADLGVLDAAIQMHAHALRDRAAGRLLRPPAIA
jgi:hypothetical protein